MIMVGTSDINFSLRNLITPSTLNMTYTLFKNILRLTDKQAFAYIISWQIKDQMS